MFWAVQKDDRSDDEEEDEEEEEHVVVLLENGGEKVAMNGSAKGPKVVVDGQRVVAASGVESSERKSTLRKQR